MKEFCFKLYACCCKSSLEIFSKGKEIGSQVFTNETPNRRQEPYHGLGSVFFLFGKMLSEIYQYHSKKHSPLIGILFVLSVTVLPLIFAFISMSLGF